MHHDGGGVEMRRLSLRRHGDGALVAIYDALLFLMVVILISEGMFLYTATSSSREGAFGNDHYQHMADTGRIMVESLSLNDSHPMPLVEGSAGAGVWTVPFDQVASDTEAQTVHWMLQSYCELSFEFGEGGGSNNTTYDLSAVMQVVDAIFRENRLNGTDHAWLFLYNNSVKLFGSNTLGSVDDLPEDRWASSTDYSSVRFEAGEEVVRYTAELRYFLWLE